ncbi:MAG: protein kinase [Polyangiaceae bacterium]|nr:protein kinase [Polyangiaceae bacterium]
MLPELDTPNDRFVLEARAGGGGMGDVFRGVDQQTGQPIAIKLLRPTASAAERVRFMREIAILADLRHPNIVQYIAHGTWDDGRLYFAMEWLDGEDLAQRQRRAPLGMRDAVEVVRRSAAAMAAVHARGVVHRDLKLSNIFLVRGKGTSVKLIDFGVVKPAVPDEYQTERGTIIGTPHFMAPEQARGEGIDARADVYSLGAALFRLVTGRNVFETEHVIALLGRLVLEDPPNPQSIRFDVPDALSQVILRAVARAKDARFENGGELARALARVGQLHNDPPATDRSASSIRAAVPESRRATMTPPEGSKPNRAGMNERRVVAVLLYELNGGSLDAYTDYAIREVLGDDVRYEPLVGGQMVAVIGVERSTGDEALRAARAALIVAHSIPQARVAVAVGRAILGRANLAGEALERAARQLEAASAHAVRVDSHAAAVLEGRFIIQPDTFGGTLLREDAQSAGARLLLGRPTPTVGREKEIALLQGIFAELVEDGTPRAALITGPAGIGKSRVRAELLQRIEIAHRRPDVLICRGDPMSRGSSFSALGRALRSMMGVHDGEAAAEQVHKVKAHVAARMPRTLRFLAAFLGELIGVPFPDQYDEPLRAARASAQLMQSRLQMALEAFVRAQAESAPQVLVIEDTHWADDTTLDLVDWLLGCADLKFVVFAFARPDLLQRQPGLWDRRNVTRLTLAPLSPVAADRLVAAALPGADASVRTGIVSRAAGNALFLEELIRCAAEGRDDLPLTVQAVVQLRLDRMSPETRRVLRAAAVFGQVFWTGGVQALLERNVEMELAELERNETITRQPQSRISAEQEWIFRQALVRDAAYASILDEDRAELHLAAGAWLESAGDADAGLIARHVDAGGDLPRAAGLYARATQQAYQNGAQLETALELASRGLACGADGVVRAQLLVAKAQACQWLGRLTEAVEAAEHAAVTAAQGSDLWGEAQRVAASALIESGRSADGDSRAAWALRPEFGAHLSMPIRALLLATRVRGLVDLSMPTEALRVADQAVEAARACGAPDVLVRAMDARLFALLSVGDIAEGIACGTALIPAAENIGDVTIAARARLNTCSLLNHTGMFEEAQQMADRALVDARARRARILEAFALHNGGMSCARQGQLDEGIEYQREAARIADECNAARLRINARVYETVFLVWRGAPGDLGAAVQMARYLMEETRNVPSLQINASFAYARVQLARRDLGAAIEAARDAYRRASAGPVEEWEEYIRLTLAEALLEAGATQEADMVLDVAHRVLLDRARAIRRDDCRHAYLYRNEECRHTLELAQVRLGRPPPT